MFDINRVTFPSIPLINYRPEQAFKIIADAGYKNVDIIDKPPHFSVFNDEVDYKAVKKLADAAGLKITTVNGYFGGGAEARLSNWKYHPGLTFPNKARYTSVGFSSDDPKEIEEEMRQTKRAIDIAEFFGSKMVRFTPGDDDPDKLDKMLPYLKEMVNYAASKNIVMVGENHGQGILGTPRVFVEMCEKIGSDYVGVLYEPLNLVEECDQPYQKAFEIMRDWIKMVHLKDAYLDPTQRAYIATFFGEGEMDYEWVMNRLDAIGYKGYIGLEYEVPGYPVEKGARQYLEGFKKLVGVK
jgi:sugar phosphate isomerase/epimerase